MLNLRTLKVSYHIQNDRDERLARVEKILNGNWGQVVAEEWYKDAYRCLTDTGLCFIVSGDRSTIITYYFCPMKTAKAICHNKLSKAVEKKINKNLRSYASIYGSLVEENNLAKIQKRG